MKKIKGMGFTLDKEQRNIYTFDRNTVYHYQFPDLELLHTYKSLSNIDQIFLSRDGKQLAVVNASGSIAIHTVESGKMTGQSKLEHKELFFAWYMDDDVDILCADWNGKIMRLDTSNFQHEILLDLKYAEREFRPTLLLDKNRMQMIEVDDSSVKMNVCDTSSLQFEEQNFEGIVECITSQMLFGQDYYINLNFFEDCKDCNMVTFFNQKGILQKVPLPVRQSCKDYNISESGRYLVFCDSVMMGYDHVKILDIYKNKVVSSYPFQYVDYADALKFIHNDKELLIATWEGVYVESLNLP